MKANTDPQTYAKGKPESRFGGYARAVNLGVCVLVLTACRWGGPTATPDSKPTTVGELSQQFQNGECPDGEKVTLKGVTLTPLEEKGSFNANADDTSFTIKLDPPEGGITGTTFELEGVVRGDETSCILEVGEYQATS